MSAPAETVVLVHGLWMHGIVFALMRRRLARAGFRTLTWSYPSVRRHLKANADALARFLAGLDAERLHLVGHSLGGLVILTSLARHPDPRVRRVVLIGSPCSGSHSARDLLHVPGVALLVGKSVRDWLSCAPLPDLAGVDIGVIAGTRGIGIPGALVGLAAPNDGVVTVAETRLEQACDTVELPLNHTEMLFSRVAAKHVAGFLRDGRFPHPA